jgi:hypothetical protein
MNIEGTQLRGQLTPPLNATEVINNLQAADGQVITPEIFAKIDKGFFLVESDWTCYRRNYFSLSCSFTLQPTIPNGPIYLILPGSQRPIINGFAMSIAAVSDSRDGKSIELIQHSPKRDKGPQEKPPRVNLSPRPYAQYSIYRNDNGLGGGRSMYNGTFAQLLNQQNIEATFERIQFKNATANNGKRRATQQYYHLLVELLANIGQGPQEQWVKIAVRISAPMVVRGRSPGHYQSERRGSNASSGPGGTGGVDGGGSYTTSGGTTRIPGDISMFFMSNPSSSTNEIVDSNDMAKSLTLTNTEIISTDLGRINSEDDHAKKGYENYDNVVLDDSSVSSVESTGLDSRGPSSRSSFTSSQLRPSIADKFAEVLLESEGIRALCEGCFSMGREERAERNIHRLLKILAINLRSGASNKTENSVAGLLLRHVKTVASSIRRETTKADSFLSRRLGGQAETSKEDVVNNFLLNLASTTEQLSPIDEQGLPSIDEKHIPTNEMEDQNDSDEEINEPLSEPINREIEMGSHFLRHSEALVEFREGLIDFRVAVENARHNSRISHGNDEFPLLNLTWLHKWQTLASNLRYLAALGVLVAWQLRESLSRFRHIIRKALRPRVKVGARRIEWTCVSGVCTVNIKS